MNHHDPRTSGTHGGTAPADAPTERVSAPDLTRPGAAAERRVQRELGTTARADRFYRDQMSERLNDRMREFVARQEMFFLATADGDGVCDNSFRAGPPGFVQVLDDRTIAYPEYRGNGVMASLGNIRENPHIALLMIDFSRDRIGLHVNGQARLVSDEVMRVVQPDLPVDPVPGRRPQTWVEVTVDEAYIHCSKHIPRLVPPPRAVDAADGEQAWGTDDVKRKGGDYFGVAAERTEAAALPGLEAAPPDRESWRLEAERALARARRGTAGVAGSAGSGSTGGFRGWFA
ncbi:pyridoxamine 5'-phosphate oxidase family protein [Streptantibioticus parmotrematis]|uniref:pyridoxamine 5'-phosphate oxidase family protein n=1 Tax=Streptantibioticus parmotrematis TaxID=2873249 RepID=UPI0033EFB538